jgi:hypothetical protein
MTLAKRTREQHQMPTVEPSAIDSGRGQSIREELF